MKDDCLFCKIIKGEIDSKVIYEDELVKVVLDAFPNVSGHALIIPKKHYENYLEIPDELLLHITSLSKKIGPMLMEKMHKKSLTLLVNYGDSQAIKHYHFHLLPGYGKETDSKILSRDEAYKIIMNKDE
jgi:histidine triad (HIT) family protein